VFVWFCCFKVYSVELTDTELEHDLQSVEQIVGTKDVLSQKFNFNDIRGCDESSTTCDHWIVKQFVGPGPLSRMQAPHPVGSHGGSTRQPSLILGEVRNAQAKHVLEVGCGKGFCTLFLAGAARDVVCKGIDVVPRHVDEAMKAASVGGLLNASFVVDNMAKLETHSFWYDVIFGCESLCHVSSDEQMMQFVGNVKRLLRSKGRLVIIDGFRGGSFKMCDQRYQTAMRVAEKGFNVNVLPSKSQWIKHCKRADLHLVKDLDFSSEVLPFWTMGWRWARLVLKMPYLARLLLHPSTNRIFGNVLAVSMTAYALRSEAAEYGMLVFEKR